LSYGEWTEDYQGWKMLSDVTRESPSIDVVVVEGNKVRVFAWEAGNPAETAPYTSALDGGFMLGS
jgi:hypothetical protein